MDDGVSIEVVHGGHDAVLEFLFGCDADMAQDRARELGEEAFDEIEPRAVLGGEGEFEATGRLLGEPGLGLLGDVRRMIVEDQLDHRTARIGGVEELEEFNEFAAAVAILDEGVDLAADEIDAGQQADRAVALVLVVARDGRMSAGLRYGAMESARRPPLPTATRAFEDIQIQARLTNPSGQNIIPPIRGSRRQLADIKSESRPASNRNRWPASYWNAWPASSESATIPIEVQREGLSLAALPASLRGRRRGNCHPGELGAALRRFGFQRQRDWSGADGFLAVWRRA